MSSSNQNIKREWVQQSFPMIDYYWLSLDTGCHTENGA